MFSGIALGELMKEAIFCISFIAISILFILALLQCVKDEFQFWPPDDRETPQYKTFWGLFRTFFSGLCLTSILEVMSGNLMANKSLFYFGFLVFSVGIGTAAFISFSILGNKNAHGEKDRLITTGVYRFSRNPIYVTSIIGMVGWGLIFDSHDVHLLLIAWGAMYMIAPFLEEPWLEQCYGRDYLQYKSATARFFGWPSKN